MHYRDLRDPLASIEFTTGLPAASGPRPDQVVGREPETAALDRFLQRAAEDGSALVITGDSGMGKSAVLALAADRAARRWGATVKHVACVQFEAGLCHAALHQLFLPDAASLASMSGLHRTALETALGMRVGTPPERLVLATAIITLLRRWSADGPLLLVVDDLHWADRASAAVLSLVASRLAGTHVGLLLAQRTGQESYFDLTSAPELHLGPLSEDAAIDLVRALQPALHPSVRHRLITESGGNPLAMLELHGGITSAQQCGAEALPTTLVLSDRLRAWFATKVASLPPPTRTLLLHVALAEGTGTHQGLMTVVATSEAALEPAESTGLVALDRRGSRVVFSHPLIRAAVVELATSVERRAAHRRLAALAADADVRTLHLAEAALAPDEAVASRLVGVAERALDHGDAIRATGLLLRAADLTARPTERARRVAEAAFISASVTGALSGAACLLARARAERPDGTRTLQEAVAAAAHLVHQDGDIDTAHRLLVAALDEAPTAELDRRTVEQAVVTLMTVCSFGGRPELWTALDDVVRRFRPLLSESLRVTASTFADPARLTPKQLSRLDHLTATLDDGASPTHIMEVAQAQWSVGQAPLAPLRRVVAAARTGDTVALAAKALVMLAVDAFFSGSWEEAASLGAQAVTTCEEHGYALLLCGARLPGMLLGAARGDTARLDEVRAHLHQWALPRNALAVRTFTTYVDGLAALSQARHHDALRLYRSISEPGTLPPHGQLAAWMVLDVVEAAVRCGELEAARAHVAAAARIAGFSDHARFRCSGANALSADDDAYPELFEALLADPSSTRWPFELARLELAYGERLRRDRAMRRARPHLERAYQRFVDLAATPWAERALAMLAATGPTRRVGVEQATELTGQELQIARLAASGLSNREIGIQLFVSPRTVGAHLYRVFPKLGVTSRAALRDALTARGH